METFANARWFGFAILAAILPLFLLSVAGCRNDPSRDSPTPDVLPSVTVSAVPGATPSAIVTPPPVVTVAVVPRRSVPGKTLADGSVIAEFSLQRDAGDEGLVWLDAADHCTKSGLRLCTSTQWQVACEADSSIASVETWTMTPQRTEGFVVRGLTAR
jgi:hypothetical protein